MARVAKNAFYHNANEASDNASPGIGPSRLTHANVNANEKDLARAWLAGNHAISGQSNRSGMVIAIKGHECSS